MQILLKNVGQVVEREALMDAAGGADEAVNDISLNNLGLSLPGALANQPA